MPARRIVSLFILLLGLMPLAQADNFPYPQDVPESKVAVLRALYNMTNGAGWTDNTGWDGPAETVCSWYGVSCSYIIGSDGYPVHQTASGDGFDGSVVFDTISGINLSGNNLTGNMPSLLDLAELTHFRVDNNKLTGSIPPLSGLTALRDFAANSNQLTGSIPPLSGLTKLESFNVSFNELTGSIPPLSGLLALQAFLVHGNQITGSIPSLNGLTALTHFYAHANKFTGSIPSLSGLTALRSFNVDSNQLTGSIPSLTGLTALLEFNAGNNQLTGSIPSLDDLTALESFLVEANDLIGNIPAAPASLVQSGLCGNHLTSGGISIDAAWNPPEVSGNVSGDWLACQTYPLACNLTVSPIQIANGDSSTLTAFCTAATSYAWVGGTCAGTDGATCTVTPWETTTYTVTGSTSTGAYPSMSATVTVTGSSPFALNLTQGWNLKGNSSTQPIDVTTLGNAKRVSTVWKWNQSASKWAFYTPTLTPADLATYAQGKGYDVLTSIAPREGFWVNAPTASVSADSLATGVPLVEGDLQQGWNLLGGADNKTPSQLYQILSSGLYTYGKVMVSAWAWDAASAKWRFYAPSLEAQSGTALADYISGKGYMPFSTALSAADGFWMNIGAPAVLPTTPASFDIIMAALDSMPPSAVSPNNQRSKTISDFDAILWGTDETKATPTAVLDYYRARVARVALEIELPVTTGFRLWQLYNHGYIVKTPTTTFAFDLVEGKGSWNGPAWNVELPNAILDKISILFISHEHGDHYDDTGRIPAYIKAHGGDVVYPKAGAAKPTTTLLMSPNDSALIKDIRVNAYASMHNVPTLIYEVITASGHKIVHSGDTQDSRVLPPLNNIHVLLLNGWINESGGSNNLQGMKNALTKLKPDLMIPGHFEELAHPRSDASGRYRYTYGLVLQDDPNALSKTVVLTWGDRLDYTEPTCVAPLVRTYHECVAP